MCVSTIADNFSELLQNARRANATRVRVTFVESGGDLALSVNDDGRGIAEAGTEDEGPSERRVPAEVVI